MMIFAFFPGLPFVPFMGGALMLGYVTYTSFKTKEKDKAEEAIKALPAPEEPKAPSLGDALDIDEISVELAPNLVPSIMHEDFGFDQRVQKIRMFIATEYGFILPAIRLTDNALLPSGTYRINIQGAETANQSLQPAQLLALIDDDEHTQIIGTNTREPVFNAPARWVDKSNENELLMLGATVIAPIEVLATHLLEIIQNNFGKLLNRRTLRKTLDTFKMVTDPERAASNKKTLDEFIPDKVPMELLQGVLRLLLEERVSIRNFPLILEAVAEARSIMTTTEQITDFVRHRLSFQFMIKLRDDEGRLPLIQVGPDWEMKFNTHEAPDDNGRRDIALSPDEFNAFASAVRTHLDNTARNGTYACVATSSKRRRFVRSVLKAKGIQNPVISYEEITGSERPAILGIA